MFKTTFCLPRYRTALLCGDEMSNAENTIRSCFERGFYRQNDGITRTKLHDVTNSDRSLISPQPRLITNKDTLKPLKICLLLAFTVKSTTDVAMDLKNHANRNILRGLDKFPTARVGTSTCGSLSKPEFASATKEASTKRTSGIH